MVCKNETMYCDSGSIRDYYLIFYSYLRSYLIQFKVKCTFLLKRKWIYSGSILKHIYKKNVGLPANCGIMVNKCAISSNCMGILSS
jgi:hypothetical protein